jgi:SAM-dependent methyltransferase
MTGERVGHAFEAVDEQADPAAWIAVLDRLREEPFYRTYKARVAELLRPRHGGRYLDVGGGTGDDGRLLQETYGVRAVVVDASTRLVSEARRRGIEAVVGEAHKLPFPNASFDGCSSDRTFQHLANPERAVAEMARVTRSGGRVVVADPDYDTQVVDVSDQRLARRVLRYRADHLVRNATLAHRMPGLFSRAGLEDVSVEAMTLIVRDHTAVDNVMGLRDWAAHGHERGLVSPEDAEDWPEVFDDAVASGRFMYAVTFFITSARCHG